MPTEKKKLAPGQLDISEYDHIFDAASGLKSADKGRLFRPGNLEQPRRKEDIYLNPGLNVPSENRQMRAPTTREKVGDLLRSVFGGVAEQPLGQIADALGITDFTGLSKPQDPDALSIGMMPGPPGSGFFGPKPKQLQMSSRGSLGRNNIFRPGTTDVATEYNAITNPEAARVAQKYGIEVSPEGNIDWWNKGLGAKEAERELDDIALRRAAAMGTEPIRLGQPNAIATTEIDHFAPTLRSAPEKRRLR